MKKKKKRYKTFGLYPGLVEDAAYKMCTMSVRILQQAELLFSS